MPNDSSEPLPTLFVRLVGVTALGVLLQAVTAGLFVNQQGRDNWVTVHGVIADVTWVLALVTAVYAFLRVRPRGFRALWLGSATLFVLSLAQTGLGHLITDKGMDGLIVVHVPLALVIFGLTTWLSFAAAQARRSSPAGMPYGDSTSARRMASPARESSN